MQISIQPFGFIENDIIDNLAAQLHITFGCPININQAVTVLEEAFVPAKNQYLSDLFIDFLNNTRNSPGKILGITDVNLFTSGLNYVFGQADPEEETAIISIHLLRQECYGLQENRQLLNERCVKEAVHELGHTFGMPHCPDSRCVMHFSCSLIDSDYKSHCFCPNCQPRFHF